MNINPEQLKSLIDEIKSAGASLGEELTTSSKKVLTDSGRDIKLELDKKIEQQLTNYLKNEFHKPVLGEEFLSVTKDDFKEGFIVDPIDGTMNFFRNSPVFCIAVAYMENQEFKLGIIYNPIFDELVVGGEGIPVTVNGNIAQRPLDISIDKAILATGFPVNYNFEDDTESTSYLKKLKKFKKIRMIGSASQSLAWIVQNRMDVYWEKSIMLWDVAAGLAILKQMGFAIEIQNMHLAKDWSCDVKVAPNSLILSSM